MKGTMSARGRRWGVFGLGVLLWAAVAGCPVDSDAVVTESVRAGLDAAVASLVDKLEIYLAGQ